VRGEASFEQQQLMCWLRALQAREMAPGRATNYRNQYGVVWCVVVLAMMLQLLVALSANVVASSQAEDAASEIAANNDQFTQWLQAMAETSDSDDEATDSGNNDNNFSNLAASSGHARTDNKAHKRSRHSARSSGSHSSGSHSSKGSKTKENYDSIGVLPPPTGKPVKITVSKHGKGDYKTINEALNSIKPNANHRTIIKIKAGVYKYVITSSEQAQLARSALTLLLLAAISSWFVQFDVSVSST
jgi:hypothetical protein